MAALRMICATRCGLGHRSVPTHIVLKVRASDLAPTQRTSRWRRIESSSFEIATWRRRAYRRAAPRRRALYRAGRDPTRIQRDGVDIPGRARWQPDFRATHSRRTPRKFESSRGGAPGKRSSSPNDALEIGTGNENSRTNNNTTTKSHWGFCFCILFLIS